MGLGLDSEVLFQPVPVIPHSTLSIDTGLIFSTSVTFHPMKA